MRIEQRKDMGSRKMTRKMMHPMFVDEIMHMSSMYRKNFVGIQIFLSLFRDDFPWIYDAGREVVEILKSKKTKAEKMKTVEEFTTMMDFPFDHPFMREMLGMHEEHRRWMKELPRIFRQTFESAI